MFCIPTKISINFETKQRGTCENEQIPIITIIRRKVKLCDGFLSCYSLKIFIIIVGIFLIFFTSKTEQPPNSMSKTSTKVTEPPPSMSRNDPPQNIMSRNERSPNFMSRNERSPNFMSESERFPNFMSETEASPIIMSKSVPPPKTLVEISELTKIKADKSSPKFSCMWPEHQSRNVSVMTQPDKVTTVINSPSTCGSNASTPLLLVMVHSALASFGARENIRESWATNAEETNTKIVFLLGQSENLREDVDQQLMNEVEMFGDIVQEKFIDSWTNLTIKSLMMLKWFDQNCNLDPQQDQIKYFMKVDEDVFINLPQLIRTLREYNGTSLLMGQLRCDSNPKKIGKSKNIVNRYNPKYHKSG